MTTIDPTYTAADAPLRGPVALPGSLAAALGEGTHPSTLLFPGIDGTWQRALASALVGRPELAAWVAAVLADLDDWSSTPAVRALGLFPDGFSHLVDPDADPQADIDPVAATAPFTLVGNLLTNLVSLAALEAEGLATGPAAVTAGLRAAGHSSGLLAAWVAAAPREAGLLPVRSAADAARIAALAGAHTARHPWAVSATAVAEALAGEESAATPMVAVSGPRTARLRAVLDSLLGATPEGAHPEVVLGVINSPTRHVLTGNPVALAQLRTALEALAATDAAKRAKGRLGGSAFQFTWEPLPSSVPFHHPALAGAAAAACAQLAELGLALPATCAWPVLDPATGSPLAGGTPAEVTAAVVSSVVARPHDWAGAVVESVPEGSVAVLVSPLGALAGVTASVLRGRGALVLDPATQAGRSALFSTGRAPALPATWARFAPRVVRDAQGALRLDNHHTRASGRSPMVLPGMTPTTTEAPIVAAAANGGHVAELAGGGQVNARILAERLTELGELLEPGQEVVLNALLPRPLPVEPAARPRAPGAEGRAPPVRRSTA